jgi:hypothetical protein
VYFKNTWLRPYYLSNQLILHNINLPIVIGITLFPQRTYAREEGNKVKVAINALVTKVIRFLKNVFPAVSGVIT